MTERWQMSRHVRSVGLGALDVSAWFLALSMATAIRLSLAGGEMQWDRLVALGGLAAVVQVGADTRQRIALGAFRIGSIDEAVAVARAWAVTAFVVVVADLVALDRPVPILALVLSLPLALTVMLGARFVWRVGQDARRRPSLDAGRTRVIVFGAGEGGEQIVRSMLRDPDSRYVPVALLDDDRTKANRRLSGVAVRGTRRDMAALADTTGAEILLIAIPSADAMVVGELDALARAAGLDVRVLPSTTELMGLLTTHDIRELTEADLLGRAEVDVDFASIRGYLSGKRVLVTGAGGSIGSELSRQLAALDCDSLVMLDRDESGLHATQLAIEGRALLDTRCLVVADIRDRDRVFEVFAEHRPNVVFHAAALKHLTLLEQYPEEGHKTNVEGSRNVIEAAAQFGVSHFVNVSTDKAADPTSVLGRTKLEAERLTAAMADRAEGNYVSVRFGNVLGSRGSVLPIFRHQIAKGGPITVTHPDVTRYFMTIPEAVRLVLQAGAIGRPGEVMILDMGKPVKIVALAERLIRHVGREIEIVFTGLRPGEKLHEILVSNDELAITREHPRIMHAVPHGRRAEVPAAALPTDLDGLPQLGRA